MGIVVNFPRKEYRLLQRREDYLDAFYSGIAETAVALGIDLEQHEEMAGGVFHYVAELVNEHLEIEEE